MDYGQGLRDAVAEAAHELRRIDEELHQLARRRDELFRFIEASQPLLGREAEQYRAPALPRSFDRVPPPVSRAEEATLPPEQTKRLKSDRRQYLRAICEACTEILHRHGRPMTIHEIYDEHPERHNISKELLYQTLYKRQYQKFEFLLDGGYFWLIRQGWPQGWVLQRKPGSDPKSGT